MSSVTINAADGGTFSAYVALPDQEAAPGILVIQEIFGVNSHIREVADGYASQGYLAVAPALFDRIKPGVELGYEGHDIEEGRELAFPMGFEAPVLDMAAAVEAARAGGRVGTVGYCWGGSLSYLAACKLDIACAVGYYGGQVYDMREMAPKCPTMLHFGSQDTGIPMEKVEAVVADRPEVEVHVYDADHGFNCDHRASHSAAASAAALERTLAFFAEHVG